MVFYRIKASSKRLVPRRRGGQSWLCGLFYSKRKDKASYGMLSIMDLISEEGSSKPKSDQLFPSLLLFADLARRTSSCKPLGAFRDERHELGALGGVLRQSNARPPGLVSRGSIRDIILNITTLRPFQRPRWAGTSSMAEF